MDDETATVEVNLPGREYAIEIGRGVIGRLGTRLRGLTAASQAMVVTDSNVGPLYSQGLLDSLAAAGFDADVATVPAGDVSKSLRQAAALYDRLADRRHGRQDPIIALGGGMVGDLSGFVAATWMRGVPFVQCPTTLEADIDAAVGGKTALNHPTGKNMIGAFHQPMRVLIDLDCLRSLSDRDYRAGLAESIKHAVIRDGTFLDWHEENVEAILRRETAIVRELIRRNCQIKAAVVVEDEREDATKGVGRAALNFGHTIGHAIEALCDYELRHGECVAIGMVAALDLAVRHCGFPNADRDRTVSLLAAVGLPIRLSRPMDVSRLFDRMQCDKKAHHQQMRFVLPSDTGEMQWFEPPSTESIRPSLDRILGP